MNKLLLTILMGTFSTSILADSMRCNNNIVSVGDTKSIVLAKCGKPLSENTISYKKDKSKDIQIETYIEELVYPINNSNSFNYLTIENGKVTKIKFIRK